MEAFYQLNIASIILTILLFVLFLVRKSYPTISRRLFKYLIAFNALSAACEILVVFLGTGTLVLPNFWQQFFVIFYYLIHITLHYIFLYYVTSSARGYLATKAEKVIFSIFYCGLILLLLSNPMHHWVFIFDETNHYEYKFGLIIIIFVCALSLVYALVVTLRNKKNLKKLQLSLDVFFLLVWLAAILVEVIVPHVYIENFMITITVLLCTIVTDNPEKYFYANTGVYNEETFNIVFGEKLKNKVPFKLVCFAYKDFNLYIQKVGLKRANVAIFETLMHLKKQFGQQFVFSLRRNVFVIDATRATWDLESTCRDVAEKCYKGGLEHNPDLKLEAQFTVIECPHDCNNLTDLHSAISMMLFDPENNKGELVSHFDTKLLDARHRRERIVMRIHDAIDHDGFEMYYQPLYNWKKNRYIGLEALIRFKNNGEDGEVYSPGEFIPIAEEEGLIFDIDEIVFEKVCRFVRNTELAKYGVEFIDINLSLLKLLDPSTFERYKELAARYEVDPKFINLEITETAEGDGKYLTVVRNNIAKFRDAGFSFSLDDYGSGYSTVVYMAEMDVKIVKIDASILWNAMKNRKYYTVLENCVRLIYCFDKECVCEGVEDEAMATLLKKLGVDFFQGYLYSKPVNEEQILKLLAEKNKIGGGLLKADSRKFR
ncbi:MAG: EAL domain-containing protein [Bacilli bacterium]|nr:EAL domain-containing protein [Bacilli bacterium]